MKRTILAIMLALALVAIPVSTALAATSQDVTVTATPAYFSIDNTPAAWTINDLGGGAESGVILPSTTYYANPITDGDDTTPPSATVQASECNFTVTNDAASTVDVDFTVTWGAFAAGDADMDNSNDGSNDATHYGAYCWYEGMTYGNKVTVKDAGSDLMYTTGLAASGTLDWGVEITTRTDAWTGGTSSTSTLTITATMH